MVLVVLRFDVSGELVRHGKGQVGRVNLILYKNPFAQKGGIEQIEGGGQRIETVLRTLQLLNLERVRDNGTRIDAQTHRIR